MSAKYGPDRNKWPPFDEDIWYSKTDNNAHGDNYGLSALGKTRSMYRPGRPQTSSSARSQSQSQSYSSAPPPLRQEDINTISGQVLSVLQPQITQFMDEIRRTVGRSPSHQGGSSSHHASIPDGENDDGDDWSDDDLS